MSLSRSILGPAFLLLAGLALASPVAAATVQVTSDVSGTGCMSVSPAADSTATITAWESDCDLAAGNADHTSEIFRATIGSAPVQITAGTTCSSMRPSMSADGLRIAFESDCDLTGGNPDHNVEIFVWDNGTLTQRTLSVGCDNLEPSISSDGKFVAFDSTCNLAGVSNDGRGSEIFRVSARGAVTLKQLTVDPNGGACDSTSASINGNGSLVAFDSDCDLVGTNPDGATEIFTVTAAGDVSQRTAAGDDTCSSVHPSIDDAGQIIAFHSNCDYTGGNEDLNDEIFTVNASASVFQVTDGDSPCASGEARMTSAGNAVVFSSFCKLNGFNADGSLEVFQAGVGPGQGAPLAVTNTSASCSSVGGRANSTGSLVMFDSDCNFASLNSDQSVEIFRAAACACGAPLSRQPKPKTSDALLALNAAVGARACNACECDANDDGHVTASDAQRILKASVNQPGVVLVCPQP